MTNVTALPAERTSFSRARARLAASTFRQVAYLVALILVEETDDLGIVEMSTRELVSRTGFGVAHIRQSLNELATREVAIWVRDDAGKKFKTTKVTNATDAGPLLLRDAKVTWRFKWNEARVGELVEVALETVHQAADGTGDGAAKKASFAGVDVQPEDWDLRQLWCKAWQQVRAKDRRYRLADGSHPTGNFELRARSGGTHWHLLLNWCLSKTPAYYEVVDEAAHSEVVSVSVKLFYKDESQYLIDRKHGFECLPHQLLALEKAFTEEMLKRKGAREFDAAEVAEQRASTPPPAADVAMPDGMFEKLKELPDPPWRQKKSANGGAS